MLGDDEFGSRHRLFVTGSGDLAATDQHDGTDESEPVTTRTVDYADLSLTGASRIDGVSERIPRGTLDIEIVDAIGDLDEMADGLEPEKSDRGSDLHRTKSPVTTVLNGNSPVLLVLRQKVYISNDLSDYRVPYMVELDIQLLVGAAVTVFLALIFFGVVVLWDVALALRSVGDKIDKLEDNVDDDLMDIAHALDGISNAPGNGGTQLHLSGGTISSGPTNGQEQGQPTQGQQVQGPQQAPQQAAGETARQGYQHPQAGQQPPQAGGPAAGDDVDEAAATEESPNADNLEQSAAGGEAEDDDAAAESALDGDDTESATNEATAEPVHPRAASNRGRFITSPDRTAWYATPLDREAIRPSEPAIAGALTDGSDTSIDESEIIAAGPVESAAPSDPAEAADATEADGAVGADETVDTDPDEPNDSADGVDANRGDERDETNSGDGSAATESNEPDAVGQESTESDETADSPSTDTDVLAFEEDETDADTDSRPTGSDDASVAGDSDVPEADTDSQPTTETGTEPPGETGVDVYEVESDGPPDSLQRPDDESDALGSEDSDDETALETEPDAAPETATDVAADPFGGDDSAFEFDDADDVTVEEAVETLNENAPAPELSSHHFEVTAEVYGSEDDDRDGAVLLFEFDTETVDISGSTKRLLQYQMRSFADRDSTPDGDVSIGRDRIVIEIPDSDGSAVQRWGEAAVGIIDRTLYLSDNSSDGN